jgi:hypothetical protein
MQERVTYFFQDSIDTFFSQQLFCIFSFLLAFISPSYKEIISACNDFVIPFTNLCTDFIVYRISLQVIVLLNQLINL